jgi:hypothetical protein
MDWNATSTVGANGSQAFPDGPGVANGEPFADGGGEAGARSDNGLRPCSRTVPCYFDEYCDYPDLACGKSSGEKDGVCRPRPATCTETGAPQCGCDGLLYTMACEAHRSGMDTGSDACAPDGAKHFACGDTTCRAGEEYCMISGFLTGRQYQCKPFVDCPAADCSCKPDPCVGSCYEVLGGGTTHDCSL